MTTPVLLTLPAAGLLLLHVPPVGVDANVVVYPVHTVSEPVIAEGVALTVIGFVAMQPVGNVYVSVAVPAETPVQMPVHAPTTAIVVLLLVHPQLVLPEEPNDDDDPAHTVDAPDIAAGNGLTVTTAITRQPVGSV